MQQNEISQNEIIQMARQAGMEVHSSKGQIRIGSAVFTGDDTTKQVEAFAKLVASAAASKEREACAKIVEVSEDLQDWEIICGSAGRHLLNAMAKEIRARGQT